MTIAVGLIITALLAIFISRLNILPKKSLPFIILALFGGFGIFVWKHSREKALRKELEKLDKEIKEREKRVKVLREKARISDDEYQNVLKKLENQRNIYKKSIMEIKAKNKEEKMRIERLSGEELNDEFLKAIGK
jgi:hypothetical protein